MMKVLLGVLVLWGGVCAEGRTGYVARFPTDAVVHVDATEAYMAQTQAGSYNEVCEAYRVAAFPYRVLQGVVWLHTRDAVPVTADTFLRVRAADYDVETQRLEPGAVLAERAFAVRAHVGHAPVAYDVGAVVHDDVFFLCAALCLHTDLVVGIGVPHSPPAPGLRNQTVFRRTSSRAAFARLPSRGARLGFTGAALPAPFSAPADWDTARCPAAAYGDGAVCDCECGAPDPDCIAVGPRSHSCPSPGAICYRGQCVDPEWSPEGVGGNGNGHLKKMKTRTAVGRTTERVVKNVSLKNGDVDDDIDGDIDSGINNGIDTVRNGNRLGDGHFKIQVKKHDEQEQQEQEQQQEELFCDITKFGTDGICQCGCGGLVDPDCVLSVGYPRVCAGVASECSTDLVCSADAWTCDPSRYGDGAVCDCECGAPDPDCAILDAEGQPALPTTCDNARLCVAGHCAQPRTWTCAPAAYGAGDGVCDCSCGALDPDCAAGNHSVLTGCASASARAWSCRPPAGTCAPARCGNGYLDAAIGEECDGGTGCRRDLCTCFPGYAPRAPRTVDCAPVCGDGRRVPEEECDRGDAFCDTRTCTCVPGHPFSPELGACAGCGNGKVDPGEECDGGEGCLPSCRCDRAHGRAPYEPPIPACRKIDHTTAHTAAVAAAYLALLAGVATAIAVVSRHRRNRVLKAVSRHQNGGAVNEEEETTAPLVQDTGDVELSSAAAPPCFQKSTGGGIPIPRGKDEEEEEKVYTTIGTVHGWLPNSVGGVKLVRQHAEPVAGSSGGNTTTSGSSVPFSMPFRVVSNHEGSSGVAAAPTLPSLQPLSQTHQ